MREPSEAAVIAGEIRSRGTRLGALGILILATAAWLGWLLDVPDLARFRSTWPAMAPATATGYLVLSLALWLRASAAPRVQRLARPLTALVMVIAAARLIGYGIDEIGGSIKAAHVDMLGVYTARAAKMAPSTALGFFLLGVALTLPPRRVRWMEGLALAAAVQSLLGIVRYLYQGELAGFAEMAMPTAVALLLGAVATLLLRPDAPLLSLLRARDYGGVLGRRLLPVAVLLPLISGWIAVLTPLEANADIALLSVTNCVLFALVVWATARAIRRTARLHDAAERRFTRVFDSTPNGMLLVTAEGVILQANRAIATLLDASAEQLVGSSLLPWIAKSEDKAADDPGADFDSFQDLASYVPPPPQQFLYGRDRRGQLTPITIACSRPHTGDAEFIIVSVEQQRARVAAERERAEEHARFLMLTRATRDAVWDWHADQEAVWMSDSFAQAYGWPLDAPLRRAWLSERMHPDDLPAIGRSLAEVEQSGAETWVTEYRFQHHDGSYRDVLSRSLLLRDHQGAIIRMLGVMTDITDRKRIERQLHDRTRELERSTRELERSNADLERFAQIASHDLQEPLRTISSFVQLLAKRYAHQLDDNGRRYIAYVVDGAERMRALIEALLTYSRLDRHDAAMDVLISLDQIVEQICADLGSAMQRCGGRVTHDPLPTLRGHQAQLRQLLLNLISNALKYQRPGVPPHIHVSSSETPQEWVLSVRDNGIGIEAQYFDRIFVVFQRLHTRETYEGTGIGLAICKRIIEHHGGRIWLTSEPGEGTTFFLALPKHPAPQRASADAEQEDARAPPGAATSGAGDLAT